MLVDCFIDPAGVLMRVIAFGTGIILVGVYKGRIGWRCAFKSEGLGNGILATWVMVTIGRIVCRVVLRCGGVIGLNVVPGVIFADGIGFAACPVVVFGDVIVIGGLAGEDVEAVVVCVEGTIALLVSPVPFEVGPNVAVDSVVIEAICCEVMLVLTGADTFALNVVEADGLVNDCGLDTLPVGDPFPAGILNTTGDDFAPGGLDMMAMLVPPITLVTILPGTSPPDELGGEVCGTPSKDDTVLVVDDDDDD